MKFAWKILNSLMLQRNFGYWITQNNLWYFANLTYTYQKYDKLYKI